MYRETLQKILLKWTRTVLVASLLTPFSSFANALFQEAIVQGTVRSADDGAPLPGVNVLVEGTTAGTTTDASGQYTISVSDKNAILVFSFIGYVTQKIAVNNQGTIDISLGPDIQQLSEVIVVGYGVQKRSDVTGSVASVPKERLSNLPVTNLMHAIQGTTAGLNIIQNSSVPGSSGTMRIRGINSINANTSPFIVLDGVPFFGVTNDINPNDIESIEILKDASAVAIYGTRGSNGVILITTKRGAVGKPHVSYNGYAGVEGMAHVLTPMNPDAYVQKYEDYLIANNLTQTQILPNTFEVNNYNAGLTTDWLDVATQPGRIQDHNVSLNGGTDNTKYYVGVGYLNQKGVVKGYQFKRINFRTNLDVTATDFLKLGTSVFFTNKNTDGGRVNLLNATAMSPYSQPYTSTGQYEIYPMFPELLFSNPLIGLSVDRLDRGNNLTSGAYAEVTPGFLKGFKYRLQGSYVLEFGRFSEYSGRQANNLSGNGYVSNSETGSWVLENLFTYTKNFDRHHVDFTGLYSAQKNRYFTSNISVNGFVNDELSYNNLAAGTSGSWGSFANSYALLSQMARVNYTFDGRYLFTFTARRDGYSAFGEKADKYAVFPVVALGWNIHNENFITNTDIVNQLKLRFSYGKTGNQAISPNQTATTASTTTLAMNGSLTNGVLLGNRLGNEELKWETTLQSNLGLDFAVIKNRLAGTIEIFKSTTEDILLLRSVPNISGYTQVWDNLGKLENKGVEVTLRTTNLDAGGFKWETNLNFSSFRNKILDLYGDKRDDIGNRWFIGKPLQTIYDYEMVGVWQEGEGTAGWDASAKPGDLKFKDQITVDSDGDGVRDATDGVINADDRIVLGTRLPKWYGGITNTFHYRNFHLNVFIQTSQGSLKNNVDKSYADERGRRNIPAEVGYWTPENKSNVWPSLAYNNQRGYGYPSDNSYVRIKDVTLSYSFPQSLISRARLSNLTVYVAGRNLRTFTEWIGWDPENDHSGRGGGDWTNNYPLVRTYSFGVNVTL
ncbi:MAG TPA: TonB-dependent receptor [Chryseosolibacter sp.]|nr:TonB-dependent receptor [Chryseosolibacter sp.]